MILKAGVISFSVALVLMAVAVVMVVTSGNKAEKIVTAKPVVESEVVSEEQTGSEPAVRSRSAKKRPPPTKVAKKPSSQEPSSAAPSPSEPLPVAEDWPTPNDKEVSDSRKPRRYDLPPDAVMGLTIKDINLYNAPVFDSNSQEALDNGVVHVPQTSFPWSSGNQRNVYLAGHRLGYEGTGSRLIFYNLDELGRGDEITLRDRDGKTYRYRVIETFIVNSGDSWVMGEVRDRDLLTLQTCTPIPTFEKRLIVRAERI